MALDLPTYIPLEKAAEQFNVAVETLRQNVEDGAIRAAKTPAGGLLVAGEDVGELKTQLSGFSIDEDLKGKPIRVTEAAEKYDINHANLSRWSQLGYIRIIEQGPKLLVLDEGEVQRAAKIFKHAKKETGSPFKAGWILKRVLSSIKS
jgi:predicted site-specific integrase-resolvase